MKLAKSLYSGLVFKEKLFSLRGVAWAPGYIDRFVDVALFIDGELVQSVRADELREAKNSPEGKERYGFTLIPPPECFNGTDFSTKIVNQFTGEVLYEGRNRFADAVISKKVFLKGTTTRFGLLARFKADRLEGWALDPEHPHQVLKIVLLIDGKNVSVIDANRKNIFAPPRPRSDIPCGFDFRLPASVYDNEFHNIALEIEGTGLKIPVPDQPKQFNVSSTPSYGVNLALKSYRRFEGTFGTINTNHQPVQIEVLSGGRLINRIELDTRYVQSRISGRIFDDSAATVLSGRLNVRTVPDSRHFVGLEQEKFDGIFILREYILQDSEFRGVLISQAGIDCLLQLVLIEDGAVTRELEISFSPQKSREPVAIPVRQETRSADLAFKDDLWKIEKVPAAPVVPKKAERPVIGKVEKANRFEIRGWAAPADNSADIVELILSIGQKPFAVTRAINYIKDLPRPDMTEHHIGFKFEIPPNIRFLKETIATVAPTDGYANLSGADISYAQDENVELPFNAATLNLVPVPEPGLLSNSLISIIVLNSNGSALLQTMFQSFEACEKSDHVEWIIVDHASTDDSRVVCDQAMARGHDVKFFARDRNYSYSESNNWGADQAAGQILLFANNDIIFRTPFVGEITRGLSDQAVGGVGCQLSDWVLAPGWEGDLPIQHLGIYLGPRPQRQFLRPYEGRAVSELDYDGPDSIAVPAATGAFFAMRAEDFRSLGGFDGRYYYGLEDVDLCLRLQVALQKKVVRSNRILHAHHRGFTRMTGKSDQRREDNNKLFNALWGNFIRRKSQEDVFARPGFWFGQVPTIAFVVTDVGDTTKAGDYFTALELGQELSRLASVRVKYLPKSDWYDLRNVDVVIAMVDGFNPRQIINANFNLTCVAWARNWFDRWCSRSGMEAFDQIWASSAFAVDYMKQQLQRDVTLVPIATGMFGRTSAQPSHELESDYCFTGSRHGVAREIEDALVPDDIHGRGRVFGHGWENTPFKSIDCGPLPYSEMANAYASTKVVVDDANIATRKWGSCNSRLFDAIGAGRLVVTNGERGARELFGDLLPIWDNRDDLTRSLNAWISDDEGRKQRVALLQDIVRKNHTYEIRARQAFDLLEKERSKTKIAIKCPAREDMRQYWGDYHFATSLASALRVEGYSVRIDNHQYWDSDLSSTDHVAIVLRGMHPYKPKIHQKNIMWLISHPLDVSPAEIEQYDHVYVASNPYCDLLKTICAVPVEPLLQCVDNTRFRYHAGLEETDRHDVLFVGNSRQVYRVLVKAAVEAGIDVSIYGREWNKIIPEKLIKGEYISNDELTQYYGRARYVLCDHWDDMARLGFISNRVFDVLLSGGELIVDNIVGIEDVVPSGFYRCDTAATLKELLDSPSRTSPDRRKELSDWVAREHSFACRAKTISARIKAFGL